LVVSCFFGSGDVRDFSLSLEMSLGIGEEEGNAILSSLIPDRPETPGHEVEIREVVGEEEEEEL